MPEGRGAVNEEALDYYDRLVDGMLARGLQPHHTVYHWELPSALSDLGGWTNPDVADWMADFAEVITARIGDRVVFIAGTVHVTGATDVVRVRTVRDPETIGR